jgi:hypothetical protein
MKVSFVKGTGGADEHLPSTARIEGGPTLTTYEADAPMAEHPACSKTVQLLSFVIAIVGDRWAIQTDYRHLKEEIPVAANGLELIDLVGLPMRELRNRVAVLPERTAIVYTAVLSDGEGTVYPPAVALGAFAKVANHPDSR